MVMTGMARNSSASVPHYRRIAESMKNRILHGDYAMKPIPSERQLASEFGVNYMTVRRGLQLIMNEGLLVREENGRVRVKKANQGPKPFQQIAFLITSAGSFETARWRVAIESAAAEHNCSVRTILYAHWNDSLLLDAIKGFDGIFLEPGTNPIPEELIEFVQSSGHPLVVVDLDFSHYGIPSIQIYPPTCIQILLKHLASVGCKRIACLNTQPDIPTIQQRMEQWRFWVKAHRHEGLLFNDPVPSGASAADHAHEVVYRLIKTKKLTADGLLCTTGAAGIGAMRALLDHGIEPGVEMKVCAVNGEGIAHLLNPTMTALESPELRPFLDYCLDWMTKGDPSWKGPTLLQPAEIPLFIGKSTVR